MERAGRVQKASMYIFHQISVRLLILLQNRCMQISELLLSIILSPSRSSPVYEADVGTCRGRSPPLFSLAFSVRSSIKVARPPGGFPKTLQHFLVVR